MPHIDELIGVAAVASAALFASVALQPIVSTEDSGDQGVSIVRTSTGPNPASDSIEVVGRRTSWLAVGRHEVITPGPATLAARRSPA
jgi:hypothetical protein